MIFELENRSLFNVTGTSAHDFMQSQLSNDIALLEANKIQINAYCQHQGKITSLLWVFTHEGELFFSCPKNLTETVISRFNIFKLMSDVNFNDCSESYKLYGTDENYDKNCFTLKNSLKIFISDNDINEASRSLNHWELLNINERLPEVDKSTSEKFVPQNLNLDQDGLGVSFTKGCYPGQEVVARMHYLGKPKRRMFLFETDGKVNSGDILNVQGSRLHKSSGIVVRSAKTNLGSRFLASLLLDDRDKNIFINNDTKKQAFIIDEK